MSPEAAEKLFVNQAAHLFLALAGAKSLPNIKKTEETITDALIKRKKL